MELIEPLSQIIQEETDIATLRRIENRAAHITPAEAAKLHRSKSMTTIQDRVKDFIRRLEREDRITSEASSDLQSGVAIIFQTLDWSDQDESKEVQVREDGPPSFLKPADGVR